MFLDKDGSDEKMNIDEILNQYRKEDSGHLIAYIQDIVEQKAREGEWDKGIDENSQNLTTMLLYEYATSIEKLTEGKMKSKDVIDKLAKQMGKLRFGDFRKGIDDIVKYDDMSVTSDEYQKKCRVDSKFGAHAVTYQEASGEEKKAIVLFDDKIK